MKISLKEIPFSRYGSYLAFSHFNNLYKSGDCLYLRNIQGDISERNIFRVQLMQNGKAVDFTEEVEPSKLRLVAEQGYLDICFADVKMIRFRGQGVGVKFIMENPGYYDNAIFYKEGSWEVNAATFKTKLMLTSLNGKLDVHAPWEGMKCTAIEAAFAPDSEHIVEGVLETFDTSFLDKKYTESFEYCIDKVKKEFASWLNKTVEVPERFMEAREFAAYLNWSSVVAPRDLLKRPSMYMSKNYMTNVWSWDHCFNAMALASRNPEEAWNQFIGMFDHQDEFGALPDCINDKIKILGFCKPPIHGWALNWMMSKTDYIDNEKLQYIYEPLCKWTEWWFTYRDYNKNGMPQYNHGNDSGWDNSTIFHKGTPVEAPDLAAFLALQMETLSHIARNLGKENEAKQWQKRSAALIDNMVSLFWREDHFTWTCPSNGSVPGSDSLILYLPILLGDKLPEKVLTALIKVLKEDGRFLTEYGFATESIKSSFYDNGEDGYWRGPIWAPPTLMLVEGLYKLGEKELASKVAESFCKLVAKNGAAENFNALDGRPLRDKAYTWTSSVFLILASEYL